MTVAPADCWITDMQQQVLTVFAFETVLYLFYAPSPGSLIRVHLLLCRAKKFVRMPDYHFVDHRIEILSHDKDYNKVKLYEHAEAHSGLLRQAK